MSKLGQFWSNNKDKIKNITIVVAVPLLIVTLSSIKRINGIIDENGLKDLFYGEDSVGH